MEWNNVLTGYDVFMQLMVKAPQYFTVWNLVLVICYKWTHKYVDVLLTSLVVVCMSFFFVHVHPRQMQVENTNTNIVIKGWNLVLADMLFHIIPLLLVLTMWKPPTTAIPIATAVCLMLAYVVANDVEKRYNMNRHTAAAAFVVALLGYAIIFLSRKPV